MKMNTLKLFLFFTSLLSMNQMFAQSTNVRTENQIETREEYTPLKPENGKPFIFSTKAELAEAKQKKTQVIKAEINNSISNPVRVKMLREDLWRIENAIIKNN